MEWEERGQQPKGGDILPTTSALVRPLLACSVPPLLKARQCKKDMEFLERVQQRAMRRMEGVEQGVSSIHYS